MSAAEEFNLELIFVPGPGIGHIVSAVEFGTLLLSRDSRLSITFLLINDPVARQHTNSTRFHSNPRLRLLNLPELQSESGRSSDELPPVKAVEHVHMHKPLVREALLTIMSTMNTRAIGFIVDMFCATMLDVADEFSIPTYTFFPSGAGFLSLVLSMQALTDQNGVDVTEFKGSDHEFAVAGFLNPVPAKVLPSPMLDRKGSKMINSSARRYRNTRGIFINTFQELEPIVIQSLSNSIADGIPPIYPVGPLLNLKSEPQSKFSDTISWLDRQPRDSVVFLCFGSEGSFSEAQIKHLAAALESSGRRFLWSLRRRDSSILDDILPEGFLQRTNGTGKVIEWAPQAAVLSHAAVGGFVSHCGWNSILESLWFGVPMAAWPIYAEQQVNAFQVVVEMGVAVEIRMDYRDDDEIFVSSEEIETAIQRLMEGESGVRKRAKEMREKSSRAVMDGGSSHEFLTTLVHDILHNSIART
ncbi:hypothetical protein C2S53_009612 [Perilla frutescens var. hirtella]|uniref:Glycosyltransferase n=1 Tax=Perilla frutescens var. hirtella TaxID=608512 RepID=A0AAD4JP17_PERFH|nr:hypothetical protein C2S53_009612 [Perilla frutescens var. hirtella]